MNPHSISTRVYFEDTDAGGVAYHTTYLRYMERGRTEWLRANGWTLAQVRGLGIVLVVTSVNIDFLGAAVLEDKVEVVTELTHHGRARVYFSQSVFACPEGSTAPSAVNADKRADKKTYDPGIKLCRAKVCCACRQIDAARARAIPEALLGVFHTNCQD